MNSSCWAVCHLPRPRIYSPKLHIENVNIFFSFLFLKLVMMIVLSYLPVKKEGMHSKKSAVQIGHTSFVATQYVWLVFLHFENYTCFKIWLCKEEFKKVTFLGGLSLKLRAGTLDSVIHILDYWLKSQTPECVASLFLEGVRVVMWNFGYSDFFTWLNESCATMLRLLHKLS